MAPLYRATAKHTHGIAVQMISVRLSVCSLSVCQTCVLWQNESTWRKKFNIMTNRNPPTSFPMSLWTSYVALTPKGGLKSEFFHFPYKNGLFLKKVCYKLSLCENFQRQSCKPINGLSIGAQMVGGGHAFDLKYWAKLTHPFIKRRLLIDIRPYSDCIASLWQNEMIGNMWIAYDRAMFLVSWG